MVEGRFKIQHQDQIMATHACFIHSIAQSLKTIRSCAVLAVLSTMTWEVGIGITKWVWKWGVPQELMLDYKQNNEDKFVDESLVPGNMG